MVICSRNLKRVNLKFPRLTSLRIASFNSHPFISCSLVILLLVFTGRSQLGGLITRRRRRKSTEIRRSMVWCTGFILTRKIKIIRSEMSSISSIVMLEMSPIALWRWVVAVCFCKGWNSIIVTRWVKIAQRIFGGLRIHRPVASGTAWEQMWKSFWSTLCITPVTWWMVANHKPDQFLRVL